MKTKLLSSFVICSSSGLTGERKMGAPESVTPRTVVRGVASEAPILSLGHIGLRSIARRDSGSTARRRGRGLLAELLPNIWLSGIRRAAGATG